ncbi:MAG: histidinol-phosphate transaminase [Lentisphaerae bacterium GWF2_44_16]|nr:MAG: histidinol-phosphate transaminase [Lentisphaerae bacterium GWF2_44_16]
MSKSKLYFRPEIKAMAGYAPGEQPKMKNIMKLNTNENPYPPSPKVRKAYSQLDISDFRLYPDPFAGEVRKTISRVFGYDEKNIVVGNGSDDILSMAVRCFADKKRRVACLEPTYSLYKSLAQIKGSEIIPIHLGKDFSIPRNLAAKASGANLFLLARPNSPTGNSLSLADMRKLCRDFKGIVLIDEAYADFADDNCLDFVREFENVVVSRTLSKSYSLAGMRMGFAIAHEHIIEGMMKVKDSYNVNRVTQHLAAAAISDQSYLKTTVKKTVRTREFLAEQLLKLSFRVLPSQGNFLFVSPPDADGESYFKALRKENIIIRYFPGPETGKYARISIGTDKEIKKLLSVTEKLYSK